jgi:hypothetical protein
MAKLEERKKTPLMSYLSESSSIELEEDRLVILFPKKSEAMMDLCLREDNREVLREIGRELAGREVQVVIQSDRNHAEPIKTKDKPLKAGKKTTDDLNQEEVIQEALDVFGGEILSRKMIRRSPINPGSA